MCLRSGRAARVSGFILLYTLLLVMVVAGLVLSIVGLVLGDALDVDAFQKKTVLEGKLESAMDVIVLDILAKGQHSNSPKTFIVDGMPVKATVQDTRGLLDLNTADRVLVERLFSKLFNGGVDREAIDKLDELRTNQKVAWGGYPDVAATLGLSAQQIRCLQPYITLFSGQSKPDWHYAPDEVRGVLDLPAAWGVNSALSEESRVVGQTYKVVLSAATEEVTSADLIVEMMITGNSRSPYTIRSWIWMPYTEAALCADG